jgi:hypothetical protein
MAYTYPGVVRDAAQISYDDLQLDQVLSDEDHPYLEGWVVDFVADESDPAVPPREGLKAYVLRDPETGQRILTFRGTNDTYDWQDNFGNLGWRQWDEQASDQLLSYFSGLDSPGPLTIVGHSLGGALAQYAAYARHNLRWFKVWSNDILLTVFPVVPSERFIPMPEPMLVR